MWSLDLKEVAGWELSGHCEAASGPRLGLPLIWPVALGFPFPSFHLSYPKWNGWVQHPIDWSISLRERLSSGTGHFWPRMGGNSLGGWYLSWDLRPPLVFANYKPSFLPQNYPKRWAFSLGRYSPNSLFLDTNEHFFFITNVALTCVPFIELPLQSLIYISHSDPTRQNCWPIFIWEIQS